MLEHDTPALTQCECVVVGQIVESGTQYADRTRIRAVQQNHFSQQCGLARAAAADQREYFRAAHHEVDIAVHDMFAETRRYVAYLDNRFT